MARACTVCEHPDRATIELGVANRIAYHVLAQRHGLHKDAIQRHRTRHMPDHLIASLMMRGRAIDLDLDQIKETESEGLLTNLVAIRARIYKAMDVAEDNGDLMATAQLSSRMLKTLELTARLLGDLKASTKVTNNILVLPEYHGLRVALLKALLPHPEARQAVLTALHQFETPVIEGAVKRVPVDPRA